MQVEKIDNWRSRLVSASGLELTLFAGPGILIETAALEQLDGLLAAVDAANARGGSFVAGGISPDFHPGDPVPIGTSLQTRGFIIPQAIGKDGGCGMQLLAVGLEPERVKAGLTGLSARLRHAYFDGGRDIALTRRQREAIFVGGLPALLAAREPGDGELLCLGRELLAGRQLAVPGVRAPRSLPGLDDILGPKSGTSRDGQIGSLGGGNHFAELQVIEQLYDGAIARAFGLVRGEIAVMIHTGSVSIGHLAGGIGTEAARKCWPSGLRYPSAGIFPLMETDTAQFERYLDISQATLNFAAANRFFCAMMFIKALFDEFGSASVKMVYDTPHNFIEQLADGSWLHRKGSCPARGAGSFSAGCHSWTGEPVLIPGAMGADSFVLSGLGLDEALQSASHGAGRAVSRGKAASRHKEEFEKFLARYTVVTPLDLASPEARRRPDIVKEKMAALREESNSSYKNISAVIDTVAGAGIAATVARLVPFLTVKG